MLLPSLQKKAAESLQVELEPYLHEVDERHESVLNYLKLGPSESSGKFPLKSFKLIVLVLEYDKQVSYLIPERTAILVY